MMQVTPGTHLSTDQEPAAVNLPAPETVTVSSRKVCCDGNDALGLGHPRVWLAISGDEGFVDCPYCDRRFVLAGPPAPDH